jgi:hypothetical protein
VTAIPDDVVLDIAITHLIRREAACNEDKIRYWRVLRNRGCMPPIEVERYGPKFLVIDGQHRLEAARREGALCIAAGIVAPRRRYDYAWIRPFNQFHGIKHSEADQRPRYPAA